MKDPELMKSSATIYLSVFFTLSFCVNAFSQADANRSFQETDTLSSVPAPSKHSVYSAIGYGSSKIYPGTSIPQNQTYGFAALMYGFKNQLYVTTSAFNLINSEYVADFYSFSLNYSRSLTKWFDLSLTGASFQFNKGFPDTLVKSFRYGDITMGFDWKILYTSISGSGYFSDKNQFYFQLKNSKYIQTPALFKGKAFFSFNPYVNLLFGSYNKAGTTLVSTTYTRYDTLTIPDSNNQPATDENGNRTLPGSADSNYITIINAITTNINSEIPTLSKKFGLLEINAGLPVAINLKRLTIEANAGYIIPFSSDALLPRSKGFSFMISGFLKILK